MTSDRYHKKRQFYDNITELDTDWVQERLPWGRDVTLRHEVWAGGSGEQRRRNHPVDSLQLPCVSNQDRGNSYGFTFLSGASKNNTDKIQETMNFMTKDFREWRTMIPETQEVSLRNAPANCLERIPRPWHGEKEWKLSPPDFQSGGDEAESLGKPTRAEITGQNCGEERAEHR